jgi:hypothetical protein
MTGDQPFLSARLKWEWLNAHSIHLSRQSAISPHSFSSELAAGDFFLPSDTSTPHWTSHLLCGGGKHVPHDPAGPSSCCADSWAFFQSPLASHDNPAKARVSPCGGLLFCTEFWNSSRFMTAVPVSTGYPKLTHHHDTVSNDHRDREKVQMCVSARPRNKNEKPSSNTSRTSRRTLLAGSDTRFIWASVAHIHGVPGIPDWADWFVGEVVRIMRLFLRSVSDVVL